MEEHRKRPVGVTCIAFGLMWVGVGMAVISPFAFGVSFTFSTYWDASVERALQSSRWLVPTLFFIRAAAYLQWVAMAIIGFGLWKLRNWARPSFIGMLWFLTLVEFAIASFTSKSLREALATCTWSIAFSTWPTWYLMRPRVGYAFTDPTESELAAAADPPAKLSLTGRVWVGVAAIATLVLLMAVVP